MLASKKWLDIVLTSYFNHKEQGMLLFLVDGGEEREREERVSESEREI